MARKAFDGLHSAMAAHVEARQLPGLVALWSRGDDQDVFAVGHHAFEASPPMQRDTIFRMASLTKPVVAAAAMKLVESGRLKLDEPVERFLPELANRRVLRRIDSALDDTVPAKRSITLDDLLTMRMGIGAVFSERPYPIMTAMEERGVAPGPTLPTVSGDAWLAQLASLPLIHQPGDVWMYDTCFYVLGILLARAADKPLGDVLREEIFEPLGMNDTGFHVPAAQLGRLPTCYAPSARGFAVFDPAGPKSQFAAPPAMPCGNAGLVATVDDYHAFTRMMLGKGRYRGRQLLSAKTVDVMVADHIPEATKKASPFAPGFWETRGWGYGLSVVKKPKPNESHGAGWDGGYGTSAYWDAKSGVIGILLTQVLMTSPTAPAVLDDFWGRAYSV